MTDRFLVLAPTFGTAGAASDRALAQLRELGIATETVDLRSGVRRHHEVATSEIDPLSARLSASAAHLLAGDTGVRLGFLGAGSLAVVASAAGARTSQTEGMVALFPDRNPLMPAAAPSLVIADSAPSELGDLQAAWGPAAQIVLAPRSEASYDVRGVVDPVTRLVADFASREIMDGVAGRGLVAWMKARGVSDQYPLTAMERRRLVSRLERELVAELGGRSAASPSQLKRVARVAAVLAGLGAAQLAGGVAAQAAAPSGPTFSDGVLHAPLIGDLDYLRIDCDEDTDWVLVRRAATADSIPGNIVDKDPGASVDPLTCVEVTGIEVTRDFLNAGLAAIDVDLNLNRIDSAVLEEGYCSTSPNGGTWSTPTNATDCETDPAFANGNEWVVVASQPGSPSHCETPGGAPATGATPIDCTNDTSPVWAPNGNSWSSTVCWIGPNTYTTAAGSAQACESDVVGTNVVPNGNVWVASTPGTPGYSECRTTSTGTTPAANETDCEISPAVTNGNVWVAPGTYPDAVDVVLRGDTLSTAIDLDITGWANLDVDGRSGDDTIHVGALGDVSAQNHDIDVTIKGGTGDDHITVLDVAANSYTGIDLVISGGAGADAVVVGDLLIGGQSGSIDLDIFGATSPGGTSDDLGDDITIGDVIVGAAGDTLLPAGPADRANVSIDVIGATGQDDIHVGSIMAHGDGVNIRVELDADAGSFNRTDSSSTLQQDVVIGDVSVSGDAYGTGGPELVSGSGVMVELDLRGGTGPDHLTIGDVHVTGSRAGLEIDVQGGDGDDQVRVGTGIDQFDGIGVWGSSAELDLYVNGNDEADDIRIGQIVASGDEAVMTVDVQGSAHNDTIVVGGIRLAGSSAVATHDDSSGVHISGGSGTDHIVVGGSSVDDTVLSAIVVDGGSHDRAELFVGVRGGTGPDDIRIGGLRATNNARLDVQVRGDSSSECSTSPALTATTITCAADQIRIATGSSSTISIDDGTVEINAYGGDGDDLLSVGDADYGDTGALIVNLEGGSGDDHLVMGTVDAYSMNFARLQVTMSGGDGTDVLSLAADGRIDMSYMSLADVALNLSGGDGDDKIAVGDISLETITTVSLAVDITGGAGSDTISVGSIHADEDASYDLQVQNCGHTCSHDTAYVNIFGGADSDLIVVQGIDVSSSMALDVVIRGGGTTTTEPFVPTSSDETDRIMVLGLSARYNASLNVDIFGGTGSDIITVAAAYASRYADVDLSVDGGTGSDTIRVGLIETAGLTEAGFTLSPRPTSERVMTTTTTTTTSTTPTSFVWNGPLGVASFSSEEMSSGVDVRFGDVDLHLVGGDADDHVTVGSLSADSGDIDLDIIGGGGVDRIKVAGAHVEDSDADIDIDVWGGHAMVMIGAEGFRGSSDAGDFITVGTSSSSLSVTGSSADLRIMVDGGQGDDVINIGAMAATDGTRLEIDVAVYGGTGSDQIDVQGAHVSRGHDIDIEIWAGRGRTGSRMMMSPADDIINVGIDGDLHVGSMGHLAIMVAGDSGEELIAIGDVTLTGSNADLDIDVFGGDEFTSGDLASASGRGDTIVIGDILAGYNSTGSITGRSNDVYINVIGGYGSDSVKIATGDGIAVAGSGGFTSEPFMIAANAEELFVHVSGGDGTDDISIGDIAMDNTLGNVVLGLVVTGGTGDDVVHVGEVAVSGAAVSRHYTWQTMPGHFSGTTVHSGTWVSQDVAIEVSDGADEVHIGGLSVGSQASLSFHMSAGRNDDLLVIGGTSPDVFGAGIDVADGGVLRFNAVDMGDGDDKVVLLGTGVIDGDVLGAPGSGVTVAGLMFDGGRPTTSGSEAGDTLSYAATYATFLGLDETVDNNTYVQDWENFAVVTDAVETPPPPSGGGGGAPPAPAPIETDSGTAATPTKPVIAKVTGGGTGTVGVSEFTGEDLEPTANEFGQVQVDLDITRDGDKPARIELIIDPTLFTPGAALQPIQVFLDGVLIPDCPTDGSAQPATCITERRSGDPDDPEGKDDIIIVIETTHNSVLSFAVAPTNQQPLFCDPRDDGQARYADVPSSSPHKLAVECLADADVVTGTSSFRYDPNGQLTRAQAASVIVRAAQELGVTLPTGENDSFSDVDEAGTHGANIKRLAASGVIKGYDDGTFRGGVAVTRAQFSAMMTRMFEVATGARPETVDVFSDDNGIFLESVMNEAAALGFVQGVTPGVGAPNSPIIRSQAASIIARFAGRLVAAGF